METTIIATQVPILRFPGFDGEWEEKKIGDISTIKSGSTPLRSNCKFFNGGSIPWVKTTDLNNSYILKTEEQVTEYAINNTSLKVNPIDSVLVAMYGGFNQIGRTGILKIEAATNQALSILNPEKKTVLPLYLLLWLNAKVHLWKKFAGSSRKDPNITGSDVASFPIIFPSLPEQQKIASFLTAIDDKIRQLTRKKALLEGYKKGVMQQIFSGQIRFTDDNGNDYPEWEEKKLKEIAIKKSSNISANKIEQNFGEYIIYGASGILKKVDFFEEEKDYISIVKDGAGVGRLFYCAGKSSVLGTMEIIKPQAEINTYFLYCLLSNIDFGMYVTGSTIPHIYFKDYSNEVCNVPCQSEQQKIATFLSSLDTKINAVEKQLKGTQAYKKGLLQQMFV